MKWKELNSTEQSPWEADSSSAIQQIPRILQNSKVYYLIYKIPVPVLREIDLVHAPILHFEGQFTIIRPSATHLQLIIIKPILRPSKQPPLSGFRSQTPLCTSPISCTYS